MWTMNKKNSATDLQLHLIEFVNEKLDINNK